MTATDEQAPRPTPTQAYRELAMAYATKQAQRGNDSATWGTYATGEKQGQLYLKDLVVVRYEDETPDEYRARRHNELRLEAEFLAGLNADKIKRDLKAVK